MQYRLKISTQFNIAPELCFKRFLEKQYIKSMPYHEIISWPENQSSLKEGDSYQTKITILNKNCITKVKIIKIESPSYVICSIECSNYTSLSKVRFIENKNGTQVIHEQKIRLHSILMKMFTPFVRIRPEDKAVIKTVYQKINNNEEPIIHYKETCMGINKSLLRILYGCAAAVIILKLRCLFLGWYNFIPNLKHFFSIF